MLAAAYVLTHHEILHQEGCARLEDFELLGEHVLGREVEGLLHRHEREHLQQVVLHHVADDPVLVEVAAAPLSAKVFLKDDLHGLGALTVPDGLEGDVGEAQHEQVHHELLAQVVVDPVHLVLGDHRELAHHL